MGRLIDNLNLLLEELTDKQDLNLRWFIRELLMYLIPEWPTDPQDAIFPGRTFTYEAIVKVKFTKKDGIWLDFSKKPDARYSVASLQVLANELSDRVVLQVSAGFSKAREYVPGLPQRLQTKLVISKEELSQDTLSSVKRFEQDSVLKGMREAFITLFTELKKLSKGK